MKKYLAIALATLLLACSLASCVNSQGSIDDYTPEVDYLVTEQGTFYFEEAEGETAILVKYNGKATKDDHVVIPATFNGRDVAVIGEKAFYSLAAIVEVTIPDTVVKIDKYAFARCTELTAINLPAGLLEIDDYAFAECDKLASVQFGSSLKTIGEKAFWGCTALTAVEFPATMKRIGRLAYYNCTGIQSIKFASDNFTIEEHAFATENDNLADKIDVSNLTEGSKVLEFVKALG